MSELPTHTLPNDVSRCTALSVDGEPLHMCKTCLRYLAPPGQRQSWFAAPMPVDGKCPERIEIDKLAGKS